MYKSGLVKSNIGLLESSVFRYSISPVRCTIRYQELAISFFREKTSNDIFLSELCFK